MTDKELLPILEKVGAVVTQSHIVYTSGRHGSAYVNKDALYPYPEITSLLCREMSIPFLGKQVHTVLAPAVGGVILSQWVAFHLTQFEKREVFAVYAEKEKVRAEEGFVIKRGYDRFIRGKKVLVLEDIITTGVSVRKVVETARALGGDIVGVSALCNRGGITASELGAVPSLSCLLSLNLESWDAKECPLCRKGTPINIEVGKGREFLANAHSKA